jgi:Ca-activated chloride channel family protein
MRSRIRLIVSIVLLCLAAAGGYWWKFMPHATLAAQAEAVQGDEIKVQWTGPNKKGDYITVVPKDLPNGEYKNYSNLSKGGMVKLLLPIDPGSYEIRYVTGSGESAQVLARHPISVTAAEVTLSAPAEVLQGTDIPVEWKGPNNPGDYITVVPQGAPDGEYKNYAEIPKKAQPPLQVKAPIETGSYELRYGTGQGNKVLARRAIKIIAATVTLAAPEEVVAGAPISVTWAGPNNKGDFITVVPKDLPDGEYKNYANLSAGSPLAVTAPIEPGECELRYVAGQESKVLARRSIRIKPVEVTIDVPAKTAAGGELTITWVGPAYNGDYITVVPKDLPDGQYKAYENATKGSPLKLKAPTKPGVCEVRYVSGQGGKTLARKDVEVSVE